MVKNLFLPAYMPVVLNGCYLLLVCVTCNFQQGFLHIFTEIEQSCEKWRLCCGEKNRYFLPRGVYRGAGTACAAGAASLRVLQRNSSPAQEHLATEALAALFDGAAAQ